MRSHYRWLLYGVVAVVGVVFVVSGVGKLWPGSPHDSTTLFAAWIPNRFAQALFSLGEIVIGLWLFKPSHNMVAKVSAMLLLCAFIGVLLGESSKPNPRACGCGGAAAPQTARRNVEDRRFDIYLKATENTLFAAGMGIAVFLGPKRSISGVVV